MEKGQLLDKDADYVVAHITNLEPQKQLLTSVWWLMALQQDSKDLREASERGEVALRALAEGDVNCLELLRSFVREVVRGSGGAADTLRESAPASSVACL